MTKVMFGKTTKTEVVLKYKKLKQESSLVDEKQFPPSMVRGKFRYNYLLFKNLAKGRVFDFEFQKFKITSCYFYI